MEQPSFPAFCRDSRFHARKAVKNAPDSRERLTKKTIFAALLLNKTLSITERSCFWINRVTLRTAPRVVKVFFSEVDSEIRDVLHAECGGMSDNDFTHPVLSVNGQDFCKHEHYENTVDKPRGITVPQSGFSQPVCVLPLFRSAVARVA